MQQKYMRKCLELARQAEGDTSPNPMVGCVITDEFDNVISTGFHKRCGANHAEREALLKIKKGDGDTLYVNLEPCSHYGKTPPCVDLIIEKKIKNVVIGMLDPNPKVSGIQKLIEAGIHVTVGVLEEECKKLNEVFLKNIEKKKTFVAIKTATTLDGKIATSMGSSKWITSEDARAEVRNIRQRYDAILTSSSTVLYDNPTMGHIKKVILDRKLKTKLSHKIYKEGEIYVFNGLKDEVIENVHYIKTPCLDGKISLEFVFNKLYELGIMSVLIESGGKLNGRALKYADKIYHFIAPKIAGDNAAKSCFNYREISMISECENFKIDKVEFFSPDILLTYYPI
ncbi:MAG: bifunctional diaminohydroxyphosphoribosylaminopyrimidine deaminase/5-amino-6-(5-phosphoribosylamino)uracil reductase RibD [Cyanobacteria bacterium SIG32]|nr:bifunctional diaminohydroxyphosphoribosylaminopyrimidine deaminase/5-amino-6-(5-phosphoribosylamino)uracil reductase RibD [Cyanobacteria bacterium SIG32]